MTEAGLAIAAGYTLFGFPMVSLPLAQAQEEQVEARLATNPLGPEDLKNRNWLKPEYWEGTNEYSLMPSTSKKYGFFRLLDSEHPKFPNLAILVDGVTDTDEKPLSGISFGFDTYNKRYEVKDPGVPRTLGYYAAYIGFHTPGGTLYDQYQGHSASPGNNFPNNTLHYTWARGSSPIPGNDENRLKPHFLEGLVISKELLTEVSSDIGFRISLFQNSTVPPIKFPSIDSLGKLVFSGVPVPEIPWPVAVAAGGVAAALLATHRMSRGKTLLLR